MATCKACGKEIYFLTTKRGNLIPVNAETISVFDRVAVDNHRAIEFDPRKGHISHFADCPRGELFRKKENQYERGNNTRRE